jgi:2-polyprenyl-3-methyl-5-hydroxy-6-metoxy-1,4-benzoquinol methylase
VPPGATPVGPATPSPSRLDHIVPHRMRALLKERYGVADLDNEPDPLKRMYLDFALSTVWRAQRIRDFVAARTAIAGKRYLDVGCAYGGFVAAFADAGAVDVAGFDFNPQLLDYARALLQDYGIPARLEQGSILDRTVAARFGRFDLITCNDVLEHVGDQGTALENLASLLAPGGYMCLEIPNRFAATFVLSDGHFQKFGLTSLPKRLADQRFEKEDRREHDVTYRSVDWYVNRLQRLGLRVVIENVVPDPESALARSSALFDEVVYRAKHTPGLDAPSARYAERAARQFRALHGRWRTQRDPEAGRRLAITFCEEFWRLSVWRDVQQK